MCVCAGLLFLRVVVCICVRDFRSFFHSGGGCRGGGSLVHFFVVVVGVFGGL